MDEPEEESLFYIEGPDERGCVWMHGSNSADPWARNLGPRQKVAEMLREWLDSIDCGERESGEDETPGPHAVEDRDAPPVIKMMSSLTGED